MRILWIIIVLTTIFLYPSQASEYFIDDISAGGNGSAASPFNQIVDALAVAQPGDVIRVRPGIYTQKITSQRSGSAGQPITIRADDPADPPLFTVSGEVMKLSHGHIVIDGLVLDGQFAGSDIVRMDDADAAIIRNCEIRNGQKDGIDLSRSDDVLIENTRIHHFLGGTLNSQVDAHGIVAAGQKNLTIRNCDIFYVSGDCFQSDPSRGEPLWDNVLIEDSRLWTGPLPAAAAGWNAGEIPGENAIDTKVNGDGGDPGYRAHLTVKNVTAYGFVPGYINNRAAFNIKEKVTCRMENVVAYNNEIAFRLRGPGSRGGAEVTLINCIAYDNEMVFRTEDGLEQLRIFNSTFDIGTGGQYFKNAGGGYQKSSFELRNSLFTGSKPEDAADPTNLAAGPAFFADMAAHDYRLAGNSPAIDAGVDIAEVTHDIAGMPRSQGSYDVGAYEYNPTTGLDPDVDAPPEGFQLHPNYPNPFNPETTIAFELRQAGAVTLEIFDMLGRKVRTLAGDILPAGLHRRRWDGSDDRGMAVASGTYLYRLRSDRHTEIRAMQLIR